MSFSLNTITTTCLGLALALTTVLPAVTTQAQSNQDYEVVVGTARGLNLRDKNCNVIKTLPMDTIMMVKGGYNFISCNIKGQTLQLAQAYEIFGNGVSSEGYIYLPATSSIIRSSEPSQATGLKGPRVNATAGLNIRDNNCRRVATVPNNYKFEDPKAGFGGSISLCKVRGQYYEMTPVSYKGQIYQVASAFVSFK